MHYGRIIGAVADVFSVSAFATSLVLAFMLTVAQFGLAMGFPFAYFLDIYVVWLGSNYFFEIVEHRAGGNIHWPVISIETFASFNRQVGILFAVVCLIGFAFYFAVDRFGGSDFALLVAIVVAALLPASAAVLAVTRDIGKALNMKTLLSVAAGIGVRYVFCLVAIALAIGLSLWAVRQGGSLRYFAAVYVTFAAAYVVGSLVYARRGVLGVRAPRSPEARAHRAQADILAIRRNVLTHAYGFASHGNSAGAIDHIADYIETEENSLDARLWMFHQMTRWEDTYAARVYGRRLIEYFKEQGFAIEAAKLKTACERLNSKN